jgi:hypothetical protein
MMQNLVILDEKRKKYEEVMSVSFHCGYMGHFDYTGLKECMKRVENESLFKGKFHYITMLRDPIKRYISEFRYIKNNGMLWSKATNTKCNNDILFKSECYPNKNHNDLTLTDFINCKNNVANNRQTRMLADLSDSCSLLDKNNKRLLLENAKNVLLSFPYFGLVEFERDSEELLILTYGLKFKFAERPQRSIEDKTSDLLKTIDSNTLKEIQELNDLDIELYKFAKKTFYKRLNDYRFL